LHSFSTRGFHDVNASSAQTLHFVFEP